MSSHRSRYLAHIPEDVSAGIVVFLIALPLCLGIALASGAPLFSGLIAGFVGGLVVAWLSGSQLSVSGPAAGLTVIVLSAIERLGSYPALQLALVLAGLMQLALGMLKAGVLGAYFPAAVIKGMLAAIGLILIMKQVPHALGYDRDFEGDVSYQQADTENTVSEILRSFSAISPGAAIVSAVALALLLFWETSFIKNNRILRFAPGPLLAVLWGVGYQWISASFFPALSIADEHMVHLQASESFGQFFAQFSSPDWSQFFNPAIYSTAVTLAIVASLETLLCLEAIDKLDPNKRVAPANRELKAQGIGNMLSGLIGGLPITSVIVRSSANVLAGAQTKLACFIHGLLLLITVMLFAEHLNRIPLASLAAILILTGYKLARPALFVEMYRKGTSQIVPFTVTIAAIFFTDLLQGIAVGVLCGIYFVIRTNFHAAVSLTKDDNKYLIHLHKDVSFLNKPLLRDYLDQISDDAQVYIDGSLGGFVDHDILEMLDDFAKAALSRNIRVHVSNISGMEAFPAIGGAAAYR